MDDATQAQILSLVRTLGKVLGGGLVTAGFMPQCVETWLNGMTPTVAGGIMVFVSMAASYMTHKDG